jgi:ABC-type nitrate/sulfonate/bicarbonate transport system ATPase subunit
MGGLNQRETRAPVIDLRAATKRFRRGDGLLTAVQELSLSVYPGEFVAIVGPTGCGKSTTLSLISGLEPASSGEVIVSGNPVRGIPAGIGYMFQHDAIMPWKSVIDNVAAGPRYRGASKKAALELARSWVELVGLGDREDAFPHHLSGGMRKRVALAQTLVNQPRIMLLDEPFSALDVQTRGLMQGELLRLERDRRRRRVRDARPGRGHSAGRPGRRTHRGASHDQGRLPGSAGPPARRRGDPVDQRLPRYRPRGVAVTARRGSAGPKGGDAQCRVRRRRSTSSTEVSTVDKWGTGAGRRPANRIRRPGTRPSSGRPRWRTAAARSGSGPCGSCSSRSGWAAGRWRPGSGSTPTACPTGRRT